VVGSSGPDRPADERFGEFPIPESLYQALLHLGLVDQLGWLPHDRMLGEYEEGELLPEALEAAARLLREAADDLTTGRLEWVCAHQIAPEPVEYRLAVDAEIVRQQLRELAAIIQAAGRQGFAIHMWL
jgi:hypothetical protein